MTATHATGTVASTSWEEAEYSEAEGHAKLTQAHVTNRYQGDIAGDGTLEYLMAYANDEHATFIGMERIRGRLGGRSGSFVLQHQGTYRDGVVTGAWSVVPGSGRGELLQLSGTGGYRWEGGADGTMPFTLDYSLDEPA